MIWKNIFRYTPVVWLKKYWALISKNYKLIVNIFYRELILEEDFPRFEKNLKRLIESEEDVLVEGIYRVRNRSGEIIWIRTQHRVLERDPDGKPLKLIASSEDITELKLLEQKLEQEVKKLNAIPSKNVGRTTNSVKCRYQHHGSIPRKSFLQ